MTEIAGRSKGRQYASFHDQLSHSSKAEVGLLEKLKADFDGQDWTDPGQLGRLYEARLARQKHEQRATGSFFTPDYLVAFVVQKTLGPLVEGRNSHDLSKLRILDPSCGGGAFLLGVLGFLEAHCVQRGETSGPVLRRRLSKCLVGVDIDPGAIEVTRASLQLAIGGRAKMPSLALQVGDALLPETKLGRIDAIVGNPPWGQKGLSIAPSLRARYKELYASATGVWDPFKLFVERCHQLLGAGGRWGLVLPDIILLKNLQKLRDLILDGSAMEHIAHCGQAFAGANIDAVAIVATRSEDEICQKHTLRVWPQLPTTWQEQVVASHEQVQAVFRELPGHKFNIYLYGEALALYRRLLPLERLGSRMEMHEGVHSGNVRAKLFVPEKRSPNCHKLILGRGELARYQLQWQGGWIDTGAEIIEKAAGEYANLGQEHWHTRRKVVVRRTGDRIVAAYDSHGYYVSNNMFVLLPLAGTSEIDCKALVALLNSRMMTWYFRAVQPRTGRLFAELKLVHLRDFPLPSQGAWHRHRCELAELADESARGKSNMLAERIDALVESAFEISHQELELIKLAQ